MQYSLNLKWERSLCTFIYAKDFATRLRNFVAPWCVLYNFLRANFLHYFNINYNIVVDTSASGCWR